MDVRLVCDKPETASSTASSDRVVIGTESHHAIIGVEQSFLDCRIVIDIVDISEARIILLHSLSAHAAVGFGKPTVSKANDSTQLLALKVSSI